MCYHCDGTFTSCGTTGRPKICRLHTGREYQLPVPRTGQSAVKLPYHCLVVGVALQVRQGAVLLVVAPRSVLRPLSSEWHRLGWLHCFREFISVASPWDHIPRGPSKWPACNRPAMSPCCVHFRRNGIARAGWLRPRAHPQVIIRGAAPAPSQARDIYYANSSR